MEEALGWVLEPDTMNNSEQILQFAKQHFINVCSSTLKTCTTLPLNEYLESLKP